MTILGTYILVSLGFVAIAMIEFAFILLLKRRVNLEKSAEEGLSLTRSKKMLSMLKVKTKTYPTLIDNFEEKGKQKPFVTPINLLDLVAFCLHSSAFLIFNALYWNDCFHRRS